MKKSFWFGLVILCLAVVLLTSCATKTKVEYRDRIVDHYITNEVHDTCNVYVHDSIYHTIYQKGDTVFDTKYIERTKEREVLVYKSDTCWKDSVQVVTKDNVVEKKYIPKWAYYTLAICVLIVIYIIYRIVRWLKLR